MTSDRWRQVEALFHAARERPGPERAAFVQGACAGDADLRREVESLLAQPPSAAGFLDEAALALAAPLLGSLESQSLTGRRLGAYQIQDRIGAGGMGEVYRARDTKLGRDVAIKILPRAFTNDPERLARFDREARVLAALNHPHIGAIYGVEDMPDGTRALVLELVDGPTIADRLARGSLPVKEAVAVATQVADALEAAHERGIIHRDLKPANIKVTPDGRVKVLDFGLAKLAAAKGDGASHAPTLTQGETREGSLLGTAAYMSPEQARGQTVDKRTDVWAFGCLLYELLTGQRAFAGETSSDAIASILEREPQWDRLPERLPRNVQSVLRRCLRKDVKERLRDIADARLELNDADDPDRDTNRAVPRAQTPWIRRARSRAAMWASLLLLGAGVAALVVMRVNQRERSGPPQTSGVSGSGPSRLVVLPFENLSRQAGDDWLAGAFSDSLTLGLQDTENVILVNRERLLEVNQNRARDPQHVARDLGVRYYVHGSYQRVGDDLKVVARLVEVDAGAIRLQESFTDRFGNLLHIEDDLARRFAAALQHSAPTAARVATSSIPAYRAVAEANDLYLAGRYREAVQRLQGAVAQDERYAEAWALLGKTYARLFTPNSVGGSTRADFLRDALRASQRAVELSPSLYDAQVALAATYQQLEQVESWRIAAQKAIELNPRMAEAYVILGDSYGPSPAYGCARQRDPDLAERLYRKALQLNPYFAAAHDRLITDLFWSGHEEAALREADVGLGLLPQSISLQQSHADALLWLRRADELEQQLRKLVASENPSIVDEWELAGVALLRGHLDDAAVRFQAVIARGPVTLREIDTARVYAQAGHAKEAWAHLARAFAADASCVAFVADAPAFVTYRDNPGFRDVLAKYRRVRE
jgi:serine/threonine protein kinase/tetratricopeptide (TPR) repeat protein